MKKLTAMAFLALAAFVGVAADPYTGYIYPAGIQSGTTNRFIIGGQKLRQVRGVHFSCKGLRVLDIVQVPRFPNPAGMQRRHLKNWLDGIANGVRDEPVKPADPHITEWRSNRWWQVLGTLGPLELSLVERSLFVPRNPLQDTPSISQKVIVTIAADATAKPGMYEAVVWNERGMAAPYPFLVTNRIHVKEPLYTPPHRKRPAPSSADATVGGVVLDGQVMPGEIDVFHVKLSGGRRYRVNVTARGLLPYIGDAVPGFFNPVVAVKDGSGRVVATADDGGRFRPDPRFDFTPADSGVYSIEIHDVLFRGRADFVYSISVWEHQPPKHAAKKPPAAKTVENGSPDGVLRFSGVVSKPGAVCRREFVVEKAGPQALSVTARRKGSSLDAVLTLRKAADGKELAQWDDVTNKVFVGRIPQAESDPAGTYDFKEPGRYAAEISDRTGHGGTGYFWNMEIRPPKPDFEVYSTRSTIPLYRWRWGKLKMDFVIVRKEGFDGAVTIEFPDGVKAQNHVATSGVDRVTAVLSYKGKKPVELCPVKISARAMIDGRMVRRNVVPCNEYEQAFAWKHLVPAKSFIMSALTRSFRARGGRPPHAQNRSISPTSEKQQRKK